MKCAWIPAAVVFLVGICVPAFGQERSEQSLPGSERSRATESSQQPARRPQTGQRETTPSSEPSPEERPRATEGARPQVRSTTPIASKVDETPVVTHHKITVGGKTLEYTATVAQMPINDPSGETEAHISYFAYTLDHADPVHRPLTFAFNGGPGSASIWVHMGAMGPRKSALLDNGDMPPPPFQLVDNPNTWLDQTDLVFIDPVGTGYSRAKTTDVARRMNGVQGDIQSVAEFIRMYLTRNNRWMSPLFIAGESYGTFRAAGLAGNLVEQGIAVNGVVLISTILNYGTARGGLINNTPYALYLPTYCADAWYHKRLPADLQKDLQGTLKEVEGWAMTTYLEALNKGDSLSNDERSAIIAKLAGYTGLSTAYLDNSNMRLDVGRFARELLRDKKQTIGRYDGRLTGPSPLNAGENADFDPSGSLPKPPFVASFMQYAANELKYKSDMTYYVSGGILNWDWGSENRYVDTTEALRDAFTKNPHLKVMVCAGYFDLATPYFAAEYTLNHMGVHPETQKCITWQFYEAGHMMYIDKACHAKLKRDITDFIHAAAPSSVESTTPPVGVAAALADPPSEAKTIETSPHATSPTVTAPPDSIFEKSRNPEAAKAFYKKYIDVGGLCAVASGEVADEALLRTHYIVTHILAGRPDILAAMGKAGTRLIIIGKDQVYTDMPEYRNSPNPQYLNERVRGTGGLNVTSFGEENLLNLPLDRYDDESIGVHEFCHTIDAAIRTIDPTWRTRLAQTYKHAVDKGLWKFAYTGSNQAEYWAEICQSYFDNNRVNNWNHAGIANREQLKDYDPEGYELVRTTFNLSPQNDWRYTALRKQPSVISPPDKFKVDPYYTKFTWAREFVVLGSPKVSDEALLKANDTIRRMFAYRHDLLKALINDGARLVILGRDEKLSDLPEFKDSATQAGFDNVRYLDYTPALKLMVVPEENVLALPQDPITGKSLVVSEFAKALHQVAGMREVDPNFEQQRNRQQYEQRLLWNSPSEMIKRLDIEFDLKLRKLYDAAMSKNLWKGTTAARDHGEYWAAGVTAYFDATGNGQPPNDADRPITTREMLKAYDPDLFALVDETMKYDGHADWRYKR